MKFTVLSRMQARDYTYSTAPKEPYIMISINDANALPNMFKRDPYMKDVCILHFDDVESGKTAMKERDAAKILQFVDSHIHDVNEIIVHCGAGVSRSAGVCAAIMKIVTDDDTPIFNNAKYKPNMACYRKVMNAYFGRPAFGQPTVASNKYPRIDEQRTKNIRKNTSEERNWFQAAKNLDDGTADNPKAASKDGCADNPSAAQPESHDAMADKNLHKPTELKTAELVTNKTVEQVKKQSVVQSVNSYAICIKKVADIYGQPLPTAEHVYEYAQIDTRTALSHGYPDWGSENGAMKFESEAAATEWFAENKKHLLSYRQQYDWTTLAIRQMSYSYVALSFEEPEPEELTLEQAKEILLGKQEDANEAADNAAAGYDEGFYVGLSEGYEKALEILDRIKI